MSVNEKMTAIANEVRELAGVEDALGLDAMATNVGEANEEIALQKELLEQAIAELEGKADPDLYNKGYSVGYEDGYAESESITNMLINRTVTEYTNETVTSVGGYAFANANVLVSVSLPNAKSIGYYSFNGCYKLKNVDIPNVTTTAERSFCNAFALQKIFMPKLKTVAHACFVNSNILSYAEFPELKTIAVKGFEGCSALKTLILGGETVCTLSNTDAFGRTPIASGTGYIYVPDDLVEQYKAATNWSTYAAQIKPLSELEVSA